jgi:hypothetical protein
VRGGDQEAVGRDDDRASATDRHAPAAQAARDAQVGDARGEVARDRGDNARVGVERFAVGRAVAGRALIGGVADARDEGGVAAHGMTLATGFSRLE